MILRGGAALDERSKLNLCNSTAATMSEEPESNVNTPTPVALKEYEWGRGQSISACIVSETPDSMRFNASLDLRWHRLVSRPVSVQPPWMWWSSDTPTNE